MRCFPAGVVRVKTYQGFIKAFQSLSPEMMEAFMAHLRDCHQQVAGEFWQRWGWTLFACDGSRVEVPRTRKNEKEFGRAGREKTGPQLGLTAIYHMGTGLPWDWRIGPGTESERSQLRDMLDTLPAGALLVADAGFTGYDLFQSLIEKGLFFLIRVGANVTLLKDLGLEIEVDGDTVWLWPTGKRSDPPLKLRLIHIQTESGDMYLVTNVFDRQRLPDELAETIYRMRWGVEVFFRGFKQTLGHRKMRSDAPDQALLELHWNLCGMLLLGLMGVRALIATGHDPLGLSVATALRVVREAMRTPPPDTPE